MKNNFKNILEAITEKTKKAQNEFIELLNQESEINSILEHWYYKKYLSKKMLQKEWNLRELKNYIIEKRIKEDIKKVNNYISKLNTISEAKNVQNITISIEWKSSKMWGSNPTATAKISYLDNTCEYFSSSSISGCGYDKESTAVAEALNQCNGILKELYKIKENNVNTDNRNLLGYGSGYGILPQFEGGVGVSCYYEIFDKIGYKFNKIASGKTFDVYTIEKNNN